MNALCPARSAPKETKSLSTQGPMVLIFVAIAQKDPEFVIV
jgi:hypothetical protein